ncbi:MAG: hypothetical protein ACP5NS_00360 [Candidatus Pacearchaeota archaeon]
MKLASKSKFFIGISLLVVLIISYFIKINSDYGSNYETYDTLLGKLIFHSPFVLFIYILIIFGLIFTGIKKVRFI